MTAKTMTLEEANAIAQRYIRKLEAESNKWLRIAQEFERENEVLREEREMLLSTLESMQQDRDDWRAAHEALRESKR